MASQQVLIVTPVALFEVNTAGKTVEKGNCTCAIVALPSTTPKFSLVCYNSKRETFCTSTITSSNDHSIQFTMTVGDYASFRDGKANKWSMMFLKSSQVDKFCAVLASCMFGAGGMPTHTTVIADLSGPKAEVRLGLSHRAKVKYTAFGIRKNTSSGSGTLPIVDDVIDTNGDRLYNFQPVQSTMGFLSEAKGFESSVTGMMEDTRRVIVVPTSMDRNGKSPYPTYFAVAFVVELHRILSDDLPPIDAAPTVLTLTGDDTKYDSHAGAVAIVTEDTSAERHRSNYNEAPMRANAGLPGGGVPAEHMSMIQKSASQINTATTNVRDLHDKIVSFQEDWKAIINRPKPSILTPKNLENNVKQLIMDYDRIKDEVSRRDELIKSLDDRNRDLQKRVDKAAMIAQQLLDEKTKTVETSSDTKLEKDRQIMKLQEEISRISNERDDVQRHLFTVKKLLEVSDNELRDTKGKSEVHNVQAKGIANKLDMLEDQVGEERSRRKGLEAKVAHLQEEIRNCEGELHLRTALLEETRRRADAEKNHQSQIMEDERQRRSFEAQQLRTEIIEELQMKENKFQSDRTRTAEEYFRRGHGEGKELGRRQARVDVEARVLELQMEAQRAKTALDAFKTQLRQTNEEAMAENRRLGSIVRQLKLQVDAATKKKAQQEFTLQGLQSKVRNAEDNLYLSLTTVAQRLIRPVPASNLVMILTDLKNGKPPKLGFQDELHKEELNDSKRRRFEWIVECMSEEYINLQESLFSRDYIPPLKVAAGDVIEAVSKLWKERDESFAGELLLEENVARYAITFEENDWFQSHLDFFAAIYAAQHDILEEENRERMAVLDEETPFWDWVQDIKERQAAERLAFEEDVEEELERVIFIEEKEEYHEFVEAVELVVLEKIISEQEVIIGTERINRTEAVMEEGDAYLWIMLQWKHIVQINTLIVDEICARHQNMDEQERIEFDEILAAEKDVLLAEQSRLQELEDNEIRIREAEERMVREAEEAAIAAAQAQEEEEARAKHAAEMEKLRIVIEAERAEQEERDREEAAEAERAKAEARRLEEESSALKGEYTNEYDEEHVNDEESLLASKKKKEKKDKKKKKAEEEYTYEAEEDVNVPEVQYAKDEDNEDDEGDNQKVKKESKVKHTHKADRDKRSKTPKRDIHDDDEIKRKRSKSKESPSKSKESSSKSKEISTKSKETLPKKPKSNLFGSDSDDEPLPKNAPKPSAPKKVVSSKKAPVKKSLFADSDSD